MADAVEHPPHYTAHPSGVECITVTEHMGFNLGNAVKYIWRADEKGKALEDLRKAAWYVQREIAKREAAAEQTMEWIAAPGAIFPLAEATITEGKPADWADVEPGNEHNKDGQYDRSVCTACSDAFVECTGCETYFCDCSRTGACV